MSLAIMEDRYIETHKTWNTIAQLYEEKFMDIELYNDSYKKFCELLSTSNATVLEIGCGPGNITRRILDWNPNLKVLATDVSVNMIDLARRNNPNIDVQILDCRNLRTIRDKFDGIICGFTIPYLAKIDMSNLMADCAQSLNENGILYLSFVNGDYSDSGFISGSSGDRTYFYYYDLKTIKHALELNNMIIVDHSNKEYKRADDSIEIHTIINARKQSCNA